MATLARDVSAGPKVDGQLRVVPVLGDGRCMFRALVRPSYAATGHTVSICSAIASRLEHTIIKNPEWL